MLSSLLAYPFSSSYPDDETVDRGLSLSMQGGPADFLCNISLLSSAAVLRAVLPMQRRNLGGVSLEHRPCSVHDPIALRWMQDFHVLGRIRKEQIHRCRQLAISLRQCGECFESK
jgi:hypothetical protein